jgi:hypothetical protein
VVTLASLIAVAWSTFCLPLALLDQFRSDRACRKKKSDRERRTAGDRPVGIES